MKDYMNFMNRQTMSQAGMERLLNMEKERPEPTETPIKVPQWFKYCGMAACLALFVGVCALAVLPGSRGIDGPGPIATSPIEPNTELYFNEVVSVPFTDQAIAGGMGLNEVDAAQAAELFGCAPDDFPGFLESMGLGEYDMEYDSIDMDADPSNDDPGFRFLMKGSSVTPMDLPLYSDFAPVNQVWLEIYEGHSYLDEEGWQVPVVAYNDTSYYEFTPCEINGHKVVAAAGKGNDWHAAAAFDVESGGKTYGVYYSATTYGDENARELVSKLVKHITANGIFPQRYDGNDIGTLEYEKLAVVIAADGPVGEEGDVNRDLTAEELEKVFPACAGEADYQWWGNARLNADGALRQLSIRGTRWDGTAQINLEMGNEAEIFYLRTEKDGKTVHPGVENPVPQGVDLLRCYYRTYPEYDWWWDGETLANAVDCTCQYKPTGSKMVSEITTFVKNGTLEDNEEFNTKWVRKVIGGIQLSSEEINQVIAPSIPGKERTELAGTYYLVGEDGSMRPSSAKLTYDDGEVTISSEALNFHTCVCSNATREFTDGKELLRMMCDKCGGIYAFEVLDEHHLCFDMNRSGVYNHHNDWTFEVVEGSEFVKIEEGEPWEDYKIGTGVGHNTHSETHHAEDSPIVPIDSLDWDNTYVELDISAPTHHPEPTHHVRETHHPEPTHHADIHH